MKVSKQCSKCNKVKLLKEFSPNKTRKDGKQDKCKLCVKEYEWFRRYKDGNSNPYNSKLGSNASISYTKQTEKEREIAAREALTELTE